MIIRFIARLFQIAFAFMAASVAAGAAYSVSLATTLGGTLGGNDILLAGLLLGGLFGFIAAAPALVAVLVGELFQLRSWIFYTIAGALIAVGSRSLINLAIFDGIVVELSWLSEQGLFREYRRDLGETARQLFEGQAAFITLSASGLVGGLVYWLVAGHSAGGIIRVSPGDT